MENISYFNHSYQEQTLDALELQSIVSQASTLAPDQSAKKTNKITLNKLNALDQGELKRQENMVNGRGPPSGSAVQSVTDFSSQPLHTQTKDLAIWESGSLKKSDGQDQVNYFICVLANPRSGSQRAKKYLTDFPQSQTKILSVNNKIVTCRLMVFDVTNKSQKAQCFANLEQEIEASSRTQIIIAIMGGDGSLASTVRELRTNPLIDKKIDKIHFSLLPYGTGNDTASVFGWGRRPGEWSESPDTLINALVTATPDSLTIWHVHVDGELYNSSDEKLGFNELCMTCYFNLGVDAEIGNTFERKRTKSRTCNYLLYAYYGAYRLLTANSIFKLKDYISAVQQRPANTSAKVITDMKQVKANPLNMVGMNLPSAYGGVLQPSYQEDSNNRTFQEKVKHQRKSGVEFTGWDIESSSNEEEEKVIQRYDDDKMELLGASGAVNFALFRMSHFSQVKSPYSVEFREDLDKDRQLYFAVDGEFYKIKGGKRVQFKVDSKLPRIRMLRYKGPQKE